MAYHDAYRNAQQLTATAQAGYEALNSKLPMSSIFPDNAAQAVDFSFDRLVPGLNEEAEYREFDAETALAKRTGSAKVFGTIPPLALAKRLSELDRIQMFSQDAQITMAEQAMDKAAEELGESVARRLERGRVSALISGTVDLANSAVDDQMAGVIDFGRAPELKVTGNWSDANADVFADIEAWCNVLLTTQQVTPVYMYVSGDVYEKLRTNKNVRDSYYAGMASVGPRVRRSELSSVFADETPIMSVVNMTELYTSQNLGIGNPWPNGTVVLAPAPGTGFAETRFGVTAQSTDPKFGFGSAGRSGLMSHAYSKDGVWNMFVQIDALAVPIMPGVNQVVAATITL